MDISSTLFDEINLEKNIQVCFQNNIFYIINKKIEQNDESFDILFFTTIKILF